MLYLVCYDIETTTREGRRRLSGMARFLERHGTRVQNSVFEVRVTPFVFDALRRAMLRIYHSEKDSLRIYHLDAEAERRVEIHGDRGPGDFFGQTIV